MGRPAGTLSSWCLAVAVAILVPVVLMLPWMGLAAPLAIIVTAPSTIFLGLPIAIILAHRGLVGVLTVLATGATIGVLPAAVLLWPADRMASAADPMWGARSREADLEIWHSYFTTLAVAAGLGAASALGARATLKARGALSDREIA